MIGAEKDIEFVGAGGGGNDGATPLAAFVGADAASLAPDTSPAATAPPAGTVAVPAGATSSGPMTTPTTTAPGMPDSDNPPIEVEGLDLVVAGGDEGAEGGSAGETRPLAAAAAEVVVVVVAAAAALAAAAEATAAAAAAAAARASLVADAEPIITIICIRDEAGHTGIEKAEQQLCRDAGVLAALRDK